MQDRNQFLKLAQYSSANREYLLFGLLYALMHVGILFIPNAVFWDDWVLYRSDPGVLLDKFRQTGSMLNNTGYLHLGMLKLGLWSYKLFTFVLMFGSAVLLDSILKRILPLSKEARFVFLLLFLLLPFNMARVALIDFPYTLRYFVFFLAWYLIWKNRYISLALFFISFNTNSQLVFYALPMLEIAYREKCFVSWRSLLRAIVYRLDFIALPFIFFIIKVKLYTPYGLYEGYNQNFNFDNVGQLLKFQLEDFRQLTVNNVLFLAVAPIAYLLLKNYLTADRRDSRPFLFLAGGLGLVAIVLAEIPYLVVGYFPAFTDWQSRHQLLLPLGSALTLTAFLFLLNKTIRSLLVLMLVSFSMAYGIQTYYAFFMDWSKQKEIINIFSNNDKIKSSKLIVIKDEAIATNALSRKYRFYEWNGMLEKAYGDQSRFAVTIEEVPYILNGSFDKLFSEHYKAAGFRKSDDMQTVLVEIREVKCDAGLYCVLTLPKIDMSVQKINLIDFQ